MKLWALPVKRKKRIKETPAPRADDTEDEWLKSIFQSASPSARPPTNEECQAIVDRFKTQQKQQEAGDNKS